MAGAEWTEAENRQIVADYFVMLREDAGHRPYNKTARNRALQTRIGRNHGSIEYKHRNISAVLKALGEDWIVGYKPAFNFQTSLVDAVAEWLEQNPEWANRSSIGNGDPFERTLRESGGIWIGPPPTLMNAPPLQAHVSLTPTSFRATFQ